MTGIKSDFKFLTAFPSTGPSRLKKNVFAEFHLHLISRLASKSSHMGGRNGRVTKQESHCGMRMIASEKGRFLSPLLVLLS